VTPVGYLARRRQALSNQLHASSTDFGDGAQQPLRDAGREGDLVVALPLLQHVQGLDGGQLA
jgi:hypothetical protein